MATRTVFAFPVVLNATAYIVAKTEEEAKKAYLEAFDFTGFEFPDDWRSGGMICGADYSDPDLPDVSLSPAMTADDRKGIAPEPEDESDYEVEGDDEEEGEADDEGETAAA